MERLLGLLADAVADPGALDAPARAEVMRLFLQIGETMDGVLAGMRKAALRAAADAEPAELFVPTADGMSEPLGDGSGNPLSVRIDGEDYYVEQF